jgi:hypothetical protein
LPETLQWKSSTATSLFCDTLGGGPIGLSLETLSMA